MFSMINLLLICTLSILGISSQLFAEEVSETKESSTINERLDIKIDNNTDSSPKE